MADKWPLANGNWSNAANWNGGTKPVAGDDVYADGRTLNVDEGFTVATLRNTQRSGGTLGGIFSFNTSLITGNVTGSTPLFVGAANLITISATSGNVILVLGGSVTAGGSFIPILHSGNCDFNLTGGTFTGGTGGGIYCINKTSSGTITINGNLIGGSSNNTVSGFVSNNGNSIINGNIIGGSTSGGNGFGASQSAGTLVITGNITGGTVGSTNYGLSFSGTSLTVNGNITGGTTSSGVLTSSSVNNITGDVTGGTVAAIASTSANIINVTGTVTASATANAISSTNANGQVYLNGNMVNNNGKMAIYAPIVWLDANNTTSAAFFTSGGSPRTLYSEDTFPNMPAEADTRDNIVYGPGSGLTGTLKMPAAADTRSGVVYDNGTVGTALFTTSLFLTELSSSTVPVAVRMQNLCTPMILGELMEAFKK